jgi:hypothetical protein
VRLVGAIVRSYGWKAAKCPLTSNPLVLDNAIPENELWLHRPPAADKLSRAINWAEKHPPKASKLDAIERKLSKHL